MTVSCSSKDSKAIPSNIFSALLATSAAMTRRSCIVSCSESSDDSETVELGVLASSGLLGLELHGGVCGGSPRVMVTSRPSSSSWPMTVPAAVVSTALPALTVGQSLLGTLRGGGGRGEEVTAISLKVAGTGIAGARTCVVSGASPLLLAAEELATEEPMPESTEGECLCLELEDAARCGEKLPLEGGPGEMDVVGTGTAEVVVFAEAAGSSGGLTLICVDA